MILQLSSDMSRIGFKISAWNRQLTDWADLELVIEDAKCEDRPGCKRPHVPGSPWVLTGCWPGHWTDIDVANFRPHDLPEYHAIVLPAYGLDNDGRVVFLLNDAFRGFPYGRYEGQIRVRPAHPDSPPVLPLPLIQRPPKDGRGIPPEYQNCCSFPISVPMDLGPKHAPPPSGVLCHHRPRKPKCCVLASFDIDYGPGCSDHIVQDVVADFLHPTRGVEDGDT